MAERSDRSPARWRRPFIRWLDGVDAGWSVPLLLVCFVAVWTAYLLIAYAGSGLHPDVLETWTFGRHFAWGNPKHPPLMGWIAGAWTSIFPSTDWSLHLMAMTNAGLALWAVDLISKRFVTGHKRLLVLLLLMLTPAYQFHAQRFNANAALLATWPLATYFFLRSFETRAASWAVGAGLATAVATLGKYYSIFLIASFALAAIAHPARRAYFTSVAPWISMTAGVIALAPHLHWLVTTGAVPFVYVMAHAGADTETSLREITFFLGGLAAAMGLAAITWVMIAGYRLRRLPQDLAVMDPGLRLLCYVAIGTIALPMATSLAFGTDLPSLWALQGVFLFAVLIVCGASYPIERFYVVNTTVLVAGFALAAVVVAAPIHAAYRNSHGYEEGRNYYRRVAGEVTREWRELTGVPFSAVSGDDALAFATAFYSPDHPYYARPFADQYTWGIPREATLEHGWVGLCFHDQRDCLNWMEITAARAGKFVRREFLAQADLFGIPGVSRKVVWLIVPPAASPKRETPHRPRSGPTDEFSANRRTDR